MADDHADEGDEGGRDRQGYKPNSRQWRIVIRNLPFNVTDATVRAAFEAFGVIEEIHVPTRPGRDGKVSGRGFGFINFAKKIEAKEAVEKGNGMNVLGRPVAVDWALAKEIFEEQNPGTKKEVKSKKKAKDSEEKGKEKAGEEDDIIKEMKGGKVEKKGGSKQEEKHVPKTKEQEKKDRKALVAGDENNVFVRNIPLEASEQDVFNLMRKFGRMVFCKLVMDKVTNRHKGSAFVKFEEGSAAEAAVEAGCPFTGSEDWNKVQKKLDKKRDKLAKKGKLKDMLDSEGHGNTLKLFGRLLFCAYAVDRNKATELQGKEKIVHDRRNLHLSKEGLILEGTEEAKGTSPADLQKRLRAWQDKKTKLANTNFFINPCRLAVRNVSKDVSDADLQKLFAAAALAGSKKGGPPVKVTSARLVTDKERVDPVTGKGESKGYGFVEFSETEHALAALRKLNNCPKTAKASNGNKRLMIDFSVEDARIVRQRRIKADRLERTRSKVAQQRKEEEEAEGGSSKKLSRGARQRENKRKKAGADGDDATPKKKAKRGDGEGGEGVAQQQRIRMPRAGANTIITPTNGRAKRPREEAAQEKKGKGGDEEMNRVLRGTDEMVERGSQGKKGKVEKKAVGKKGGGKDRNDDFDTMVKSYSKAMFGGMDGGKDGSRWFD